MIADSPLAQNASTQWDPASYLKFARLRERPVVELLERIHLERPHCIYDLGCGTGIATQLLAKRWPDAELTGVDSSTEMLAEAKCLPIKALWQRRDLQGWHAEQPADLLLAAAVLHFIDGHHELLPRLLRQLKPGGCFAAHMPNWRDAHWYRLMLDTLEDAGPGGVPLGTLQLRQAMSTRPVLSLDCYYRLLAPMSHELDIWETEYLQVVQGQSPIFDWVKVSALRPVLLALNDQDRARFIYHYLERVRQVYPPEPDGLTLFPFKRIFIVARV